MPTQAPLLTYAISTTPEELEASLDQKNPLKATLTLVVTNSNADPEQHTVVLRGLSFDIPVGPEASDLTTDAGNLGLSVPDGWEFRPPIQSVPDPDDPQKVVAARFKFAPKQGQAAVSGTGLTFVFNDVPVNDQPGTTCLTITEYAHVSQEGQQGQASQVREGSTQIALTKYPNGWGSIEFIVDKTNIQYGESITLSWSGPQQASYSLEYTDYAEDTTGKIVTVSDLTYVGQYPAQGAPPLVPKLSTIYSLNVNLTLDGTQHNQTFQASVSVAHPPAAPPKITDFNAKLKIAPDGSSSLIFNWTIEDADQFTHAELSADPGTLLGTTVTGHSVKITPDNPLSSAYTIKAVKQLVGRAEPLTDTFTGHVKWEVIGSLPAADGPIGASVAAVSKDGTKVYVANGNKITVLETSADGTELKDSGRAYTFPDWGPPDHPKVTAVAISPDGRWLYSYVSGSNAHWQNASFLIPFDCSGSSGQVLQRRDGDLAWQKPKSSSDQVTMAAWPRSRIYLAYEGDNQITVFLDEGEIRLLGQVPNLGHDSSEWTDIPPGTVGSISALFAPNAEVLYVAFHFTWPPDRGGYLTTGIWIYEPTDDPKSLLRLLSTAMPGARTDNSYLCLAPFSSYPSVVYECRLRPSAMVFDIGKIDNFSSSVQDLGDSTYSCMVVTPDSSRIYIISVSKGVASGVVFMPSVS